MTRYSSEMSDLLTALRNSRSWNLASDQTFDRFFESATRMQNVTYPPYNVMRKGDNFTVEVAVAGFDQSEIDIQVEKNTLSIVGKREKSATEPEVEYTHRGLAARNFSLSFPLGEDMVVQGAELDKGILSVYVDHVLPEEKKPRKIPIGYTKSTPELLTE